jgi:hypothetical protein
MDKEPAMVPRARDQSTDGSEITAPAREEIADRPHHWTIILSIAAVVVSMTSAATAVYQYRLALQARTDAREAAKQQKADMERTRKAAEDSASASRQALGITERSARAAEASAAASKQALSIGERTAHAAEVSADAAQKLYYASFIPAVDVMYNSPDGALHLWNKGKENIQFWGFRYNNGALQSSAALIAPNSFTAIYLPEIVQLARTPPIGNEVRPAGSACELYIRTANQLNYAVPVFLWMTVRGRHLEQLNPVVQTIKALDNAPQVPTSPSPKK